MAAELKACTKASYRRKSTVIITFVVLLSCFALVMIIYNLVRENYLLSIAWLIATILAGTYVLIRINTVFSTYIMTDKRSVYIKNWSNDFLPYDYENKIKILSEFIPAKTKLVEVPIDEISSVLIGTKNFIKRNIEPDMEFIDNIKMLEKSKDFYRKRTISSMDIFYVETYDRECYYIPVVQFDTKDIIKIVQAIMRLNPNMNFKSSSRAYRKLMIK
ncbi:MAG: hypothetical protein J1F01_02930 [Oscillospiraceae bacterium]|nr:hypothetical protein [Oscillospiraceae bacterium]